MVGSMTTTTQALATSNLPNLTFDQLGIAYGIAQSRALLAAGGDSIALTRAYRLRDRIVAEASRRGAVIRKSEISDGYICGPSRWFEPIR